MLPRIPYENGANRIPIMQFGGLDRRVGAGNGAITDMKNLTGNDAPVLSSRPKRKTAFTLSYRSYGIGAIGDTVVYVDASDLYRVTGGNKTLVDDTLDDNFHTFTALGKRLLMWPENFCYDTADSWSKSSLDASVTQSCTFADGTYAGESAAGNTIVAANASYHWAALFKVGDGVTITGAADAGNNKTAIVREIDGNKLRFYENTFTVNSTAANITVARTVPDLDYHCVIDNRVWGCKDDTICCCKLGDPTNWNVFDGLSTDAWSVETGTPGDFTGCVAFMGYPIFFKKDKIFKVYGNRLSNFEVMSSATLGCIDAASLAVAGETLFYLSPAGFVRYNGGYPAVIDAVLNRKHFSGTAGSDGRRYFVCAQYANYACENLVYDTQTGLWHREDAQEFFGMAYAAGALWALTANTGTDDLLQIGDVQGGNEAAFESSVTFGELDSVTINRSAYTFASKYPVRLWLRYALDARNETANGVTTDVAALTVTISYNGGAFRSVTALPSGGKNVRYVPVPIKRCDRFSVKLSANSAWKLYGMQIEVRTERSSRKGG